MPRRTRFEIEPDEILLDSSNLPSFDTDQFEGRIERPLGRRSFVFLGAAFLLLGVVYAGKAYLLQVVEGAEYRERSENNRLSHALIFAERGIITDRNGVELALSVHEEGSPFAKRQYTAMDGLGHVLGYAKAPAKDRAGFYYQDQYVGVDGVEKAFDAALAGVNGLKITETDALGNLISESVIAPPQHGEKIALSIDAKVQEALFLRIKDRVDSSGFTGGSGIIMDLDSGELIALTNYPEYSPQVMTDGSDKATITALLNDKQLPFLNRATSGLFTPGSIVKPFVALEALRRNVIHPNTQILSTGELRLPNPFRPGEYSVFPDWKAHGWVDMRDAIAVSSNVYFFEVGGGFESQRGIGIEGIEHALKLFGLSRLTGIGVVSEKEGVIPTPAWKEKVFPGDQWRIGDTYNTAIGQYSTQITPLQAVRAVAAIGNGGTLLQPTLIKGERGSRETIELDRADLEVIREGMRQAALSGTAAALNRGSVAVAAKTGTAELDTAKRYVNSWVIGYFPYESPRYAFALLLERGPYKNLYGAAGVAGEMIDWFTVYAPGYVSEARPASSTALD